MNSQVYIPNFSVDSFDSQFSQKQNNSSTSSTLPSLQFVTRNESQTETAKKVFQNDINLFFASKECYFLGEFQYQNTMIIRDYISNREFRNQKIYHTHLKQKYSTYLQSQIIIAHGLFETSAHYMEIAFSLVDLGYEVHLFDFSGFGHSGGKRMNSTSKELQSDFISIYERLSHSRPIYVIACSIAVPIVLSSLILNPETIKIDGFISYSAMMSIPRFFNQQNISSNAILYLLSKLNPSLYLNLKLNLTELHKSNYQIKKDILLNDSQTNCISIGMAFELIKIQNFVLDNLQSVISPLLILYGQEDQIVNQQDSITLYCKVGNLDKTIKILKDQQHLFLLDSNKTQVLDLIYQWIDVQNKHFKNITHQQQDIITYTHTLPSIMRIKQDFTTQIKAESKRVAPAECNSGILSFCSNNSESTIPRNSDDEVSEEEEEDDQSESESIKKMFKEQKEEKQFQIHANSLSVDSLQSTNSQNLNKKDNPQNNKVKQEPQHNSPAKKKIKRVEEDCNICQQINMCDYYHQSSCISYSNPFDPVAKVASTKQPHECKHCNKKKPSKKQQSKKQKYIYGTNFVKKSNLKQFIKFILYGIALVIIKILLKNSNIFQLKNMRDILQKYAQDSILKFIKLAHVLQ